MSSRGRKILFVDADGATKFSDLVHVEAGLDDFHGGKDGMAVSVGSRAHLQDDAVAQVKQIHPNSFRSSYPKVELGS